MRAATVAPKTPQEHVHHFVRDPMFEALRFFMRARPFEANHIGEKFFCQTVPKDQMLGDLFASRRKLDASPSTDMQKAAARHSFQSSSDGWGSDAQIFGQARADRDLLFLDEFPDGFKVVFLRDTGFFAAQGERPK